MESLYAVIVRDHGTYLVYFFPSEATHCYSILDSLCLNISSEGEFTASEVICFIIKEFLWLETIS